MASLPPLPPGFVLDTAPPQPPVDPYKALQAEGFVFTNGFRTAADVERIRAQGYKPATNGAHNRGDGVDVDHPALSRAQQALRLNQMFKDWKGAKVLDEGHHRHVDLPGWGAAPGTPGTPNSGLPPLPEGFELEQRGSLKGGIFVSPPPLADETEARVATIKQNGFPVAEEVKLINNVKAEPVAKPAPADGFLAPLAASASHVLFKDQQPEGPASGKWGPDLEAQFQLMIRDKRNNAERLRTWALERGRAFDNAEEVVTFRDKHGLVSDNLVQKGLKPVVNKDGAFGAASRGVADPFNVLDEVGAVVDTLGGTSGRENVWSSERGIGDILYSNIDANRAVLRADERDHFGARLGGQVVSGLLLPFGNKARTAGQLAKWGAVEGALSGFGAGEGNALERVPNALTGAALGAAAGYGFGKVLTGSTPIVRGALNRVRSREDNPSAFDGFGIASESPDAFLPAIGPTRVERRIDGSPAVDRAPLDFPDADDLPPIPAGFALDEPAIGRTRPMGERLSAEEVADLARGVNPEDVRPIPANWVESPDELPTSLRTIEGPGSPGRAPKRPARFTETLKARLAADTRQAGVPVRIDAEDAINNGVPAELIYKNPDVVDKAQLQLRNPSLFGTRFGKMGRNEQVLRSLDMDDVDPVEWGFDNLAGQRLGPEAIGDLLRRDLEGDPSALQRGGAYDAWTAHQERAAQRAEFADRYPEGAPVEQAGQTITLDDLNALQPPASAYEDRPRFTGMVGNINLDRLESPEDVSRLISQVQVKVGGFDEAKRGVVTNEETRALADELGLTPDQLLKRRRGQALNAEQLYTTRVLVQKSREVVGRLAKDAVGGTDEQVATFRNAWMRHVALEEQVTAATAEVGRAMQSFKMLAKAGDAKGEAVKAYLRGGGGRETVEDAAQKLVDLMEDPAAANTFLRDGAKVRKRDMLNEVWINSLLSGPRTHVVNFTSNALTSLYTLPEQVLTAGIGRMMGTADRAMVSGVARRAVGMIQGAREGLALARHALVTGEPLDSISKMEVNNYHAVPGKLGEVIRTPSRLLTASDEFWKAIIRNGHTHQEAYQRAMRGSGSPEQKMQRYRDLVLNPDGDLMKSADNAARYYTFQQPLGAGGRGIQQFVNNVPLAKLIVPFVRTPINILKFATERSVFAPGLKEVREAMKAGGNRRNEAVARMTMGSGLSTWAVMAALDGKISAGPPSDSREAAALRNSGWQPYSIKIGDRWVSYQRFEPISLLAGVAADFATVGKYATSEEADNIALGLSMAIAKNLTSKTWLSGLSDFMEVLSDSERYGERWVQRMAGSMAVPAVVAHAAGSMDPYLRETRTILDGIRNRIPVLAEGLPVRRNVWGDPVKRGDAFGPDYISPVYATQEERSPFLQEMARLRALISMPSKSLRVDGKTHMLTPPQYDAYVQLAGKPAKQYLEQFIRTPEWKAMDADTRREFLKETMTEFRASAREGLKERFPELRAGKLLPMPRGYEMPPLPPGSVIAK